MLYSLITQLIDQYSFLNVFKYLTFRTGLSMFTSMFVVLLIGTPFIKFFSARKILNPIRDDGPTEHIVKKIGTNTNLSCLNISHFTNHYDIWILSENCPKTSGKCIPCLRIYLGLAYPSQSIFNWVFYCKYIL